MDIYQEFIEKKEKQKISNQPEKVEKIHKRGKLTAQERLELLYDNKKYEELFPWVRNQCNSFGFYKREVENEGAITAYGTTYERKVAAFSQDAFVFGGSLGEAQGKKLCNTIDLAIKTGVPMVGLIDGSGARVQEGVAALHGYCSVFGKTTLASGWIPQISVILGSAAGGAAYAAGLTDFVIMERSQGRMFVTGPSVIKSVTGEDVTFDALGGSHVHGTLTGTAHFIADSEEEAIGLAKRLLSFLPSNSKEKPPVYGTLDAADRRLTGIRELIPEDSKKTFDMKKIIYMTVDDGDFLEIQRDFALSMIIGFARMNGRTVGIVANQPRHIAGCIDGQAACKAARFVRFCDSFQIPLVTFADCPGCMPGVDQEHSGILGNGGKLLFAFAEATVPKITVVVRKDYGGAYSAMCGKGLGADTVLAFPTAQLAVMGAEGAANLVYKREIEQAENKEDKKNELIECYKKEYLNPYRAAEYRIVDDIIEPEDLRRALNVHLSILEDKEIWSPWKKHSNIPL